MPKYKQGSTITFTKGKQYTVKLKGKVGKESISLFIERYLGTKEQNGKKVPKFEKEFIKMNLPLTTKTKEEKDDYIRTLKLAEGVRKIKEDELVYIKAGAINPDIMKRNFVSYMEEYLASYKNKDIDSFDAMIKKFKIYIKDREIYPEDVDKKFLLGFRDYLQHELTGYTPNSYFSKLRRILNLAVEEGMFLKNPAIGIYCKAPSGIRKAILDENEIRLLYNTPAQNPEIKRAFLFCLNTGLRFSDVKRLKFSNISNGKIIMIQSKTQQQVTIDLNKNALSILMQADTNKELVFTLPERTQCIVAVKKWAHKAGIAKNITWHSSRHTFATLLLQNNANIKTVSSLLGHSSLNHTQKYLHLVDSLKKDAVETLPEF